MRHEFLFLTLLWLTSHLLDTATTLVGFQHGLIESNPIPSLVFSAAGLAAFLAWKWLWVGLIPLLCWSAKPRWQLWPALQIGIAAAELAVVNNLLWIARA